MMGPKQEAQPALFYEFSLEDHVPQDHLLRSIDRFVDLSDKGRGKDQYVALPYAILKSPAWRSLSGAAIKVWCELHTRYNGGNNGKLTLSMNEAVEALGISKSTAQRAFAELQDKGFIALHTPGNWYSRRAHEWRLTTKPMHRAKAVVPATNEWRDWRPMDQPEGPEKTKHGTEVDPWAILTGP